MLMPTPRRKTWIRPQATPRESRLPNQSPRLRSSASPKSSSRLTRPLLRHPSSLMLRKLRQSRPRRSLACSGTTLRMSRTPTGVEHASARQPTRPSLGSGRDTRRRCHCTRSRCQHDLLQRERRARARKVHRASLCASDGAWDRSRPGVRSGANVQWICRAQSVVMSSSRTYDGKSSDRGHQQGQHG